MPSGRPHAAWPCLRQVDFCVKDMIMAGRESFFHACSGPRIRVWVRVGVCVKLRVRVKIRFGFGLGLGTTWTGTNVFEYIGPQ